MQFSHSRLDCFEKCGKWNSVTISLFDVYTTSYFLTETMILEEHREAVSEDEL